MISPNFIFFSNFRKLKAQKFTKPGKFGNQVIKDLFKLSEIENIEIQTL